MDLKRYDEITKLIAAFRITNAPLSISPENEGYLMQRILDEAINYTNDVFGLVEDFTNGTFEALLNDFRNACNEMTSRIKALDENIGKAENLTDKLKALDEVLRAAETVRESGEALRTAAEKVRVSNETARVEAEARRARNFNDLVEKANELSWYYEQKWLAHLKECEEHHKSLYGLIEQAFEWITSQCEDHNVVDNGEWNNFYTWDNEALWEN